MGRIGTQDMTTIRQARRGFEKKFALDEEAEVQGEARRNRLLGLGLREAGQ